MMSARRCRTYVCCLQHARHQQIDMENTGCAMGLRVDGSSQDSQALYGEQTVDWAVVEFKLNGVVWNFNGHSSETCGS